MVCLFFVNYLLKQNSNQFCTYLCTEQQRQMSLQTSFNMKYILVLLSTILLTLGCQEAPSVPQIPEVPTIEETTANLDSVYLSLQMEIGEAVDNLPTFTPYKVKPSSSPVQEVYDEYLELEGDTIYDGGVIEFEEDTIVSLDSERGLRFNLSQTTQSDSLSAVLGITDVIFVWKGDTCVTNNLDHFFNIYYNNETYCLQTSPSDLKGRVVFLMASFMLTGDPIGGVEAADQFIRAILEGSGLSEYVAYCKIQQ